MTTEQPYHEDPNTQDAADAMANELEALRGQFEQLQAQALLERADLDNQRKRLSRDLESARRFANERLLSELLPVFDSLEAGLANAAEEDPLRAGVELTLRQLQKVAESNGLLPVAPGVGEAFDPEKHQAMSAIASADVAPGAIVQVFQRGYVLSGRLLRPALVVVANHD